jgi:hypothetical protein
MGRIFVVELEGRSYRCKFCGTHLALPDQLVSKVNQNPQFFFFFFKGFMELLILFVLVHCHVLCLHLSYSTLLGSHIFFFLASLFVAAEEKLISSIMCECFNFDRSSFLPSFENLD